MVEIRWTLQAAEDLESIVGFMGSDSPHYARLAAMDVFGAIEKLADFPQSGRMVPEVRSADVREIVLGHYRIIYRIRRETV
jgi:toxin ParE1/3/4